MTQQDNGDMALHSKINASAFFEEDGTTRKSFHVEESSSSAIGGAQSDSPAVSTTTSPPVRRDEPHILKEGLLLKRTRRMPRRWLQRIVRLILSADGSHACLEYAAVSSASHNDTSRGMSSGGKTYRYNMRKIKSAEAAGGSVIKVTLLGNTNNNNTARSRNDDYFSRLNANISPANTYTSKSRHDDGGGGGESTSGNVNEVESENVFFLRASSVEDAADWAKEISEVVIYLTELDRDKMMKEQQQQQSAVSSSSADYNENNNDVNNNNNGDKAPFINNDNNEYIGNGGEITTANRAGGVVGGGMLLPRMPELIPASASADSIGIATASSMSHIMSQAGSILIESGRLYRELSTDTHRQLRRIFSQFTRFGAGQSVDPRSTTIRSIDGARFAKLCRDAKILDARVSTISVDIVFAKVKSKGKRRISYEQFIDALALLAIEKEMSPTEVVDMVLESHGPTKTKTTETESVRLHDDKSTYTGVYARGGPDANIDIHSPALFWDKLRYSFYKSQKRGGESNSSNNGNSSIATLYDSLYHHNMLRRPDTAPANASSGIKDLHMLSRRLTFDDESMQELLGYESSNTMAELGMGMGAGMMMFPEFNPIAQGLRLKETLADGEVEALREVFWSFNVFGADRQQKQSWENKRRRRRSSSSSESMKPVDDDKIEAMDGARFAKLFRDCGLLVDGELDATQTDLIFSRVCTVAARGDQRVNLYSANTKKRIRKMSFDLFLGALSVAAEFRNADPHVMVAELLAIGRVGPYKNEVTPVNYVALHDNKNTYTGVYANGGPEILDKKFTLSQLVSREPHFKLDMRCAEDS